MVCVGVVKIQVIIGIVDLVLGLGKINFWWKLSVLLYLDQFMVIVSNVYLIRDIFIL